MRARHLAANGLRFHCLAGGPDDGPLVLLLHGWSALSVGHPRAFTEALEGAGHWLQFERPDDVSRLLVEWIGASTKIASGERD
jgi:pimeloyl-ACP methyl ester carboxylesterase